MSAPKQAVLHRKRVYEYVADDGTVFWSFTRLPAIVNPPRRLVLRSKLGRHILNFVSDLRTAAEMESEDPESAG